MKGKRDLNFASMTLNSSAFVNILVNKQLLKATAIQELVFLTTLSCLIVEVGLILFLDKFNHLFYFTKFHFHKSLT